MMDKQYIQTLIEEKLQTTGYELITLKISAQNEILVEVDKLEGVDVEFCAEYADAVSMFFDGQILTTDTPRRFFGSNSFYTTAANRMSRCVFRNAVTAGDVAELYRKNLG